MDGWMGGALFPTHEVEDLDGFLIVLSHDVNGVTIRGDFSPRFLEWFKLDAGDDGIFGGEFLVEFLYFFRDEKLEEFSRVFSVRSAFDNSSTADVDVGSLIPGGGEDDLDGGAGFLVFFVG